MAVEFFYFRIYRGKHPFSEPETQAIRNFIARQKQKQEFLVTIDFCG